MPFPPDKTLPHVSIISPQAEYITHSPTWSGPILDIEGIDAFLGHIFRKKGYFVCSP